MAALRLPLFLAAALAATPAPAQTWVGQLFNQSGSDWVLRLHPAPAGRVNAPLMTGLDGALHPSQLTQLEAPGDTVAIPRGEVLIFWFRDPPQFQAHPEERVTFDLVDPAGQAGAVGAYWRRWGVNGESGTVWEATCPDPYGRFQAVYGHRLLIVPPG